MKNYILLALFIGLFTTSIYSQNSTLNVTIGDVFTIAEVQNNNYKHINFPKANFIKKKGGISNYDAIVGEKVEVTSVKEKKDGTVVATIKLSSNKRFFNSHKYVTVDIAKAIESKELLKV